MHSMINRSYLQLALGLSLVLASHAATAAYLLSDVNNNSSRTDAQSIESSFSSGVTATDTANGVNGSYIFNSSDPLWEWVSIDAPTLDASNNPIRSPASKDYYSFNVISGQSYIFDIDTNDTDIDSILRILDASESQLAINDDMGCGTDPGDIPLDAGSEICNSFGGPDSLLEFTFGFTGTAFLEVSDFGLFGSPSNIEESAAYMLQVSRTISPIPVPAAVWLFGTALLGFVGMARRTTIKS